jgi:hypothetical protein
MVFQGVQGPIDLSIEQMGNKAVVTPAPGAKLLLVDACNAVLDFFKVAGAREVTVTQPDGPTLNIMSSHSRDLFDSDHQYRVAPMGAIYEVSSASQGGR